MPELVKDESGWNGKINFLGELYRLHIFPEGDSASPTPRQLITVASIEEAPVNLMQEICQHARAYCERVDEYVGLEDDGITIDYQNISQHFRATNVLVPELGNFDGCIYGVQYECDWEPEHGMQILFEDGNVVSCGPCNGMFHSGRHWLKYLQLPAAERKEQLQAIAGR